MGSPKVTKPGLAGAMIIVLAAALDLYFAPGIGWAAGGTDQGKVGYAILVEGSIKGDEAGTADYHVTTRYVYYCLQQRGIKADDIYYLTSNPAMPQRRGNPTKWAVEYALTDWAATKMSTDPAPLYFIFVDHGTYQTLYIDQEEVTASDLNNWLTSLESRIRISKRIVLIIGACYAGSFLPAVSKPGRAIITSTGPGEESVRGPSQVNDQPRDGEFFVSQFFSFWAGGKSLKESFQYAVKVLEEFGPIGNQEEGVVNQHPLWDDQGDH
ncbi:MAG: hypothetical protein HQK59_13260 [Deltaproteobacteria bacterium]|nr:hypothetical protein [Deltaproteobacteria bacterium]